MYIFVRKDNHNSLGNTALRPGATQAQNDSARDIHLSTINADTGLDEDQVIYYFLNEADARRVMDRHEYDLTYSGDTITGISFTRDDDMGWISVSSTAADDRVKHEIISSVPTTEDSDLVFNIYDKDMVLDTGYNGVVKIPVLNVLGESVEAHVTIVNGTATIPFCPSKVCIYRIFGESQKRLYEHSLKIVSPLIVTVYSEGAAIL